MATTTNLLITKLDANSNQPEVVVNAALDILDVAASANSNKLFQQRPSTTTGLTWGFYGGTLLVDGVLTTIAAGTTLLAASTTNYVESTRAGVVTDNATSFTSGQIPLYEVVTGTATITSSIDRRSWDQQQHITSKVSVAVTTADVTLTAAQARARYLTTTGALTANRNVIVPNDWEGIVFCNNTGAFTLTVKTSAGTGIVVGQGLRAVALADGTNVVRISADV